MSSWTVFEARMNVARIDRPTWTRYRKHHLAIVRASGTDSFEGAIRWLAAEIKKPIPKRGAAKRGERRSTSTLRGMVSACKFVRNFRGAPDWTASEQRRMERVFDGMAVVEAADRRRVARPRCIRKAIDGPLFDELSAWAEKTCRWFEYGIRIIWGGALRPGDIPALTRGRATHDGSQVAGTSKLPLWKKAARDQAITWRPVPDPAAREALQTLWALAPGPTAPLLPEWEAGRARGLLRRAVRELGWPTAGFQWVLHSLRHGAAVEARKRAEAAVVRRGGWAPKSRAAKGYARLNCER